MIKSFCKLVETIQFQDTPNYDKFKDILTSSLSKIENYNQPSQKQEEPSDNEIDEDMADLVKKLEKNNVRSEVELTDVKASGIYCNQIEQFSAFKWKK